MKLLTRADLAVDLDNEIKKIGNDVTTACLYRSYAGSRLLNLKSSKNKFGVMIGSFTLTKGNLAVTIGAKGYDPNDEPQRTLESGEFHAWIVDVSTKSYLDLSSGHFSKYDKTGRLGALNLPPFINFNKLSFNRGDLSFEYKDYLEPTKIADKDFESNGMPEPLWQITYNVGKMFGITVPRSYLRDG